MKYEWFIGLRYLMSRRKQTFISIISIISVGCVALGIATVVVAIAVLNGYEDLIIEKFLANEAYITVSASGAFFADYEDIIAKIKEIPDVKAASPVVYAQAGIQTEDSSINPVIVKGIDPEREEMVTGFSRFVEGKTVDFDSPLIEAARKKLNGGETITGGIILGKYVARRLGVTEGDKIILISRLVPDRARPGALIPMMRNFIVIDTYNSGMYIYDNAYAFLPLDVAQRLYREEDKVNRIEVMTADANSVDDVRNQILKKLRFGLFPKTWMEMHLDLFDAMKMEKRITFIIEALIIVVAAFGIASTLIMMVMEKTKDIGILKAMGATKGSIRYIFIIEGSVIGIFGSFIGTLLGLGLCWAIESWNIPMPYAEVYQISTLPAKISWGFVAMVNAVSLFICCMTTLYPAWHASNFNPVEALRYE
ncbi:MAG: FtsX-like permease family protein [Candidatus Poribacteria bacterium]